MKINKIRLGFANNSSSTHSIIFCPDITKILNKDDMDGDKDFGWQFFTCAKKKSKANYLTTLIYHNFFKFDEFREFKNKKDIILLENLIKEFISFCESNFNFIIEDAHLDVNYFKEFFEYEILESHNKEYCYLEFKSDFYIDHQSLIVFPKNIKTNETDISFVKSLVKDLLNGNYAILGGNDNTEEVHKLSGIGEFNPISTILHSLSEKSVCNKDGNEWIIQNTYRGDMIRLEFEYAI